MNSSVSAIFRLIACLCLSFFSAKASNSPPADLNTSTVLSILENLPAGETVGDLNATDPDSGTVLTYSLSDGNATFSIDSNGTIRSLSSLDYEQTQQISIRAKVTDEHNASIEKVFTVTVLNMDEGQAPSSGSGTSQDPYLIETLAHLKWLSYTPSKQNKHYLLANDLNASETATWAQGYGFKPIASFSGSFDGRGHEIRGLTVNRPNSGNVGLFGRAWGATISQLRITQASIVGKNNVGGLAGQNVHSSSILNSSFDGSVSGNDLVGGLVGFNAHNSSIRRSSSSGSVQATGQRIGGIAGQNFTGSSITDSYSLSSLTGHRNVGGLVGLASGGTTIERSFSTGAVVGSGGFFGGFAGASFGTISNSFWDLGKNLEPWKRGNRQNDERNERHLHFYRGRLGLQRFGGNLDNDRKRRSPHSQMGNLEQSFAFRSFFSTNFNPREHARRLRRSQASCPGRSLRVRTRPGNW